MHAKGALAAFHLTTYQLYLRISYVNIIYVYVCSRAHHMLLSGLMQPHRPYVHVEHAPD